jgi:hypothetical protein
MIMLVFREEKLHDEEIKAWQFWHSRQHSVKQRILDADTKNSSGIVGPIDEITHNAITFYWNPLEGPGKARKHTFGRLGKYKCLIECFAYIGERGCSMFEH